MLYLAQMKQTTERKGPFPCMADLPEVVASLPPGDRKLVERIFDISVVTGRLEPLPEMLPWIARQFGTPSDVIEQKITRVTNRITFEGSVFNPLRAARPVGVCPKTASGYIDNLLVDPFGDPLAMTPQDTFGRVRGKHCVTASNIAKYECFHGLVIFEDSDPLSFDREKVHDYLDTAWRWAELAHRSDPEARHFFFIWNCSGRAGASQPHDHAQMTLSRKSPHARIEALRQAALRYYAAHGSGYFDDLCRVHDMLGLAVHNGPVRTVAYLTPVKEREMMVTSPRFDDGIKDGVYRMLRALRDRMGVVSFNLGLIAPPFGTGLSGWDGFPVIARAVDRGQQIPSSDFGTMELYAASVISSNPFEVAEVLRGL